MPCRSTRSAKRPWPRAIASAPPAELDQWLDRAIGENRRLLNAALWHLAPRPDRSALCWAKDTSTWPISVFSKGKDSPNGWPISIRPSKSGPTTASCCCRPAAPPRCAATSTRMIAYWRPVLRCREQERQAMVRLLTAHADPGRGSAQLLPARSAGDSDARQPLHPVGHPRAVAIDRRLLRPGCSGRRSKRADAEGRPRRCGSKCIRSLSRPGQADSAIDCLRRARGRPAHRFRVRTSFSANG